MPRAVVLVKSTQHNLNYLNTTQQLKLNQMKRPTELFRQNNMENMHLTAIAIILLVFAMGWSCGPAADRTAEAEVAPNTLSEQEKEEGFILLFDGETTTGWRSYNGDAFPEEGWVVEDGTLRCKGRGGDIIYDAKFRDFHLKIDWKISEGGNSGIFYLGQEIPGRPIWHTAPEFQVLDNERHPDAERGVDGNRKAASLYDILPPVPQNTRPAGEWNTAEIIVYRGTVFHRQNGEDVLEYHLETPEFEQMVEESKFDVEMFGKYMEGVIGLQDHSDDVWFRNIKIREY